MQFMMASSQLNMKRPRKPSYRSKQERSASLQRYRALQQQKRRFAVKVEREKNALAALPELAVKILDYVRD